MRQRIEQTIRFLKKVSANLEAAMSDPENVMFDARSTKAGCQQIAIALEADLLKASAEDKIDYLVHMAGGEEKFAEWNKEHGQKPLVLEDVKKEIPNE